MVKGLTFHDEILVNCLFLYSTIPLLCFIISQILSHLILKCTQLCICNNIATSFLCHCSLEKDVSNRPRYDVLLKHQFVLTTEGDHDTDVGAWYRSVLEQAKELTTTNQE